MQNIFYIIMTIIFLNTISISKISKSNERVAFIDSNLLVTGSWVGVLLARH